MFYSFFKTLIGKDITVELKNDMNIRGRLESVDQFLNIKLANIQVVDEERYPHMVIKRESSFFILIALCQELLYSRLCN